MPITIKGKPPPRMTAETARGVASQMGPCAVTAAAMGSEQAPPSATRGLTLPP
jgi:hypothetical protein